MEINLQEDKANLKPLIQKSDSTLTSENEANKIIFDSQYKLIEYIQNNEDQSTKKHPLRCKANLDKAQIQAEKLRLKNPISYEPYSLFSRFDSNPKHSPVYSYYFRSSKDAIYILGILWVISCLFDLVTNLVYSPDNASNIFFKMSVLARIKDFTVANFLVKMTLNVVAGLCIRIYLHRKFEKRYLVSEPRESPQENQFSLLLQNLPKNATRTDVIERLTRYEPKLDPETDIKYILMVQGLSELKNLKSLKEKTLSSILKSNEPNLCHRYYDQMLVLVKQLENTYVSFEKEKNFSGTAFVVFARSSLKYQISARIKQDKSSDNKIVINNPRPAYDFVWKNVNTKLQHRKIIVTLLLVAFQLLIPLLCYFMITYMIRHTEKTHNLQFVSVVIALGIILLNMAMNPIINWMSRLPRLHSFYKIQSFRTSFKLPLSLLNLSTLLLSSLINLNSDYFIYHLLVLQLAMIVFLPLLSLIDFGHIYKNFQRNKIEEASKNASVLNMTEKQIYRLFRPPRFDFSLGLTVGAQFYYLGLIFYVFHPLAPLLSILGIYLIRYSDRWLMVKRCREEKNYGMRLGLQFFKVLHFDILFQVLGNFYFIHCFLNRKNLETAAPNFFAFMGIMLPTAVLQGFQVYWIGKTFKNSQKKDSFYDAANIQQDSTYLSHYKTFIYE